MKVTISPSTIAGNIQAPASKSSMQRACAAAILHQGRTVITNPGTSNDDQAALQMISDLGATVSQNADGSISVTSTGIHPTVSTVNCGESGLGIRMFAPIIALSSQQTIINGTGSLLKRPMDFFDQIFPLLGVSIDSQNGYLPMVIQGPLQPATVEVDGSLSSQFLTGLLMAFSAAGAGDVAILVNNLKSRPYIDLSLKVMQAFGMKLPINQSYETFYFDSSIHNAETKDVTYRVEGDWSGGAFLLVAGSLAGNIEVEGLDVDSVQIGRAHV